MKMRQIIGGDGKHATILGDDSCRYYMACCDVPLHGEDIDESKILEAPDVNSPNSKVWRRSDNKFLSFPGSRTRAEWQVIADESRARAADLPSD